MLQGNLHGLNASIGEAHLDIWMLILGASYNCLNASIGDAHLDNAYPGSRFVANLFNASVAQPTRYIS